MSPGRRQYSTAAKSMHWLIALAVLSQFVIAVLMPDIGPRTQPGPLIDLHLSLGVLIFALTVLRFVNRLVNPVPLDERDSTQLERAAARMMHLAFYCILLVSPFLGWASASAHRLSVTVFGLFTLPALAAPRSRWALVAGDIHSVTMWALLALVALHAAVALYHHFVRRDAVLRRMLPLPVE